jgi:hypothetical protein
VLTTAHRQYPPINRLLTGHRLAGSGRSWPAITVLVLGHLGVLALIFPREFSSEGQTLGTLRRRGRHRVLRAMP